VPLIASISGIRGVFGDGLDPETVVRYAGAYGAWVRQGAAGRPVVVVGRDGRTTGELCSRLVAGTLQAMGVDVIDAGLATTPTVAVGVLESGANGGVVLSASHNPAEWNALKLLDGNGEFLDGRAMERVYEFAADPSAPARYDRVGTLRNADFLPAHVRRIVDLPEIDPEVIRQRGFRVIVDAVNSVGAMALPHLLDAVGVAETEVINAEITGHFAHNPEPLESHLGELMQRGTRTGLPSSRMAAHSVARR
jgi:phosphomannomutase